MPGWVGFPPWVIVTFRAVALTGNECERMLRGFQSGAVREREWEGRAARFEVAPDGPLVQEVRTGEVARLSEDEIERAAIGIGEVRGEALGGAERTPQLQNRAGVAGLRCFAGSGPYSRREGAQQRRSGDQRMLDSDGDKLAVAPFTQVGGSMCRDQPLVDRGDEQVIPRGEFRREPARGLMQDELLLGKVFLAPGIGRP